MRINLLSSPTTKTNKELTMTLGFLLTIIVSSTLATKSSPASTFFPLDPISFLQQSDAEDWIISLFHGGSLENIVSSLREAKPQKAMNLWAQIDHKAFEVSHQKRLSEAFYEAFKDDQFYYSDLQKENVGLEIEYPFPIKNLNMDINMKSGEVSKLLEGCVCSLRFFPNILNGSDIDELARALETNTCLTTLSLSRNFIGDDGAKAIAKALEKNIHLITLNVDHNNISDIGASAITDALTENADTCLNTLGLSGNNITFDCADEIAEILKRHNIYSNIMYQSQITEVDACAIAKAWKKKTPLTIVNLICNNIGKDGVKKIAEALKENKPLTALNLGGDDEVDYDGPKAIEKDSEKDSMAYLPILNVSDDQDNMDEFDSYD